MTRANDAAAEANRLALKATEATDVDLRCAYLLSAVHELVNAVGALSAQLQRKGEW